jgi:hypothetical protein
MAGKIGVNRGKNGKPKGKMAGGEGQAVDRSKGFERGCSRV